ncbi:helix-turn-helix domain-containing protein [Microcella humidisoli]|uniref:helix-turn-helix domain-containing protein n=1 Tax=Microcella humidisoli TaxID=2963406 RepID=UPI00389947AB
MEHLDPHYSTWKTVNETAELLKVNPSTVRRWVSQGVLTAVRIGKTTLRVDLSSLRYETIGAAA